MKNNSKPKLTFYRVKDNGAKIQLICAKAQDAFRKEKRLLIAVPNMEAAKYVDTLLWKLADESFMPHLISDVQSKEWIVITLQDQENVNDAPHLLNLCTVASPLYQFVEEVYELYDETHPQKLELSQQRMRLYQSKGFQVKVDDRS